MRLINLGAGEVSDRLTILSLKILIGSERGVDIAHFRNERTALLTKLGTQNLNGVWFGNVLELAAVNAALWHAEDDLRALRTVATIDYVTAGQIGVRIQCLNDERAALVQTINEKTGEALGSEKL